MSDQFCGNCGTKLDLGAKFCKNCGSPTNASGQRSNDSSQSNAMPPPVSPQPPQYVQNPPYGQLNPDKAQPNAQNPQYGQMNPNKAQPNTQGQQNQGYNPNQQAYGQNQYNQQNTQNQQSQSHGPNQFNQPYGSNQYNQPYSSNNYNQPYSPNQYTPQFNQFGQPAQHSIQFEPWTDKSIFSTTVQLYKEPERVAPSIILTENSPNPVFLAIVAGLVYTIVYFIAHSKLIAALESNGAQTNGVSSDAMTTQFLTPLAGYLIGSLFVSFAMNGGFVRASWEQRKTVYIFRKIWGYLLFSMILYKLAMIPFALMITPVVTQEGSTLIARAPAWYYLINGLLYGIASVVNLITFRKICKSLRNEGGGLTFVTIVWALIIGYSIYTQFTLGQLI